jgi:hypothetical protein
MNASTDTGILLLCLMCFIPMLVGMLVGAVITNKVLKTGWMGLLPGFIRDLINEVRYGK